MASPPKPWERASGSGATTSSTGPLTTTTSTPTATASPTDASTSSGSPAVPSHPSSLQNVVNRTASNYSTNTSAYGVNRPYGTSPYGYGSAYGLGSAYSSPYSRFGGGMYGGGMYGGGLYGNSMYGGGMYGGGNMYGGMGMPGDPNDPNSMTNNFAQSTQATFQIIESIVGAFGGFAQMLESTYMATHSSFFAMVSVAEQFGNLRQTLGSILGIYTLLRWARTLMAKITGRPPPADATSLTPSNFFAFTGGQMPPTLGPNGEVVHSPPRPSKKPLIVFALAIFGLPYLMGKFIRALARNQEEAAAARGEGQHQNMGGQQMVIGPDGQPRPAALDPSKLDFCRVLYDFPPPEAVANGTFDSGLDLDVKKGDLVAVIDKSPGADQNSSEESQWWRCRARDGRMGYLPAVYLETLQRKQTQAITDGSASRANSLPASVITGRANTITTEAVPADLASRTQSMGSISNEKTAKVLAGAKKPEKIQTDGKILESFQKSWANDK